MKTSLLKNITITVLASIFAFAASARSIHPGTFAQEQLVGELVGVAAIGGESTGMMIRGNGFGTEVRGSVKEINELLYNEYLDQGKVILAKGYFETIHGVEIPSRKVFVIVSLYEQVSDERFFRPFPMPRPVPTPFPKPLPAPGRIEVGHVCGLGGPLMQNPETGQCIQSMNTCETGRLTARGFESVEACE